MIGGNVRRSLAGTIVMLGALAATAVPAFGAPSSNLGVELANNLASAPGSPQGGSAHFSATASPSEGSSLPGISGWSIDLPPDDLFGAPVFDVAGMCDRNTLQNTGACPDDARLGTGSQAIEINAGGLSVVTGGWTLYRGSQCPAGVLGCLVSWVSEPQTGIVSLQSATVMRVGDHVRFQFGNLDFPFVLGIRPLVRALSVLFDKSAMLETAVTAGEKPEMQSLPRNFIENSTICTTAGWTYTSTLAFADGSSSSAAATAACRANLDTMQANPDTTKPQVQITYPKKQQHIRSRRFRRTQGTASDASDIESVEYAVARVGRSGSARSGARVRRSARCRFLQKSGRLSRRSTSCSRPRYLSTKGTAKWRGRVRRSLPRGRYVVLARATDIQKNASSPQKRRFSIR